MIGAFDRPDRVVPTKQFGTESRLGWVGTITNLPSQTTLQNYGPDKLKASSATSMPTMTSARRPVL